MEIIFEIIFEVIVEVLGKYLTDYIAGPVWSSLKRSKLFEYFTTAIGYIIFGSIIGYISMLVFPKIFLKNSSLQLANLLFVPILVAFIVCIFGNWRNKIVLLKIKFEAFSFAYLFAFTVSFIRYYFLDVSKPFW